MTVGLLMLAHGVYQVIKFFYVCRTLKKATPIKIYEPFRFYLLLCPVLREESNIKKFLHDLSQLDYPKHLLEILIITTEKEYDNSMQPNTIHLVDQFLEEQEAYGHMKRIHYPSRKGAKADQLNFAMEWAKATYSSSILSEKYLLLLDADTTIPQDCIQKLDSEIEEGIDVYQRPLLWFNNINALRDPFMVSFAFLQSFFSIAYETPMLNGWGYPWRLKYFVGHNLCIKSSALIAAGGFPDIIEDVRLGRRCTLLGLRAKTVSGFGMVETAKSLPIYIKQSSVWFFGCGLFLSDYTFILRWRKEHGLTGSWRDIPLIFYGFFKAMRWLNKGLIHLIMILLCLVTGNALALTICVLSLLTHSTLTVFLLWHNRRTINQITLPRNKMIIALIFSPFMFMINFLGTYYGLFKILTYYICGTVTLPKTER